MFSAPNFLPLSSAIAGETVARVNGRFRVIGAPGMAHRTASFPIYRGNLR